MELGSVENLVDADESHRANHHRAIAEYQKLRSDIDVLGTKLSAADYGRSADMERVLTEVSSLKGQVNMLLQQIAPLQEMHENSLKSQERLNKVESKLRKLAEMASRTPNYVQTQHTWLPLFAIIQLIMSWVILVE
ncbi:hypothetical protein SAMN04515647_2267 [Cohaesibacter sp. ES.047]|nr:hypothetical protein SAMN04515647_2267 [Cohaesibacter sp. ES.047]